MLSSAPQVDTPQPNQTPDNETKPETTSINNFLENTIGYYFDALPETRGEFSGLLKDVEHAFKKKHVVTEETAKTNIWSTFQTIIHNPEKYFIGIEKTTVKEKLTVEDFFTATLAYISALLASHANKIHYIEFNKQEWQTKMLALLAKHKNFKKMFVSAEVPIEDSPLNDPNLIIKPGLVYTIEVIPSLKKQNISIEVNIDLPPKPSKFTYDLGAIPPEVIAMDDDPEEKYSPVELYVFEQKRTVLDRVKVTIPKQIFKMIQNEFFNDLFNYKYYVELYCEGLLPIKMLRQMTAEQHDNLVCPVMLERLMRGEYDVATVFSFSSGERLVLANSYFYNAIKKT